MIKIKRLLLVVGLLLPLIGCQIYQGDKNAYEKPTRHAVALNYLFVHGMCIGYLQNPTVTKEQFIALAQLDQETKLSVVKAVITPNAENLEQAQYLMQQTIAFVTHETQNK